MKMSIKSFKGDAIFRTINKFGKKIVASNFILVISDKAKVLDAQDQSCYLGIRVSRKVGGAVVRNKIKRRLKHAVGNLAKDLQLHDKALMIVPRSKCARINFASLQQELCVYINDARIYT